ncbi:MAG: sulfurtransferase TusA family protein [bacterium]
MSSLSDMKECSDRQTVRILDCLGLYCPEPLFRTRQEMDSLDSGEVLEVLADDPAAEEDLRRFAERTGNRLFKSLRENGVFRIFIMKH